jgi:FAD/FMN-containing dehydrogenase
VPGRDAWLSLTPEPERELPASVAALRACRPASPEAVERERERIERLVVRGRRSAWLTYLREVVELIEGASDSGEPGVARARSVALEVVRNHHRLLIGVPGPAADETADDRSRLAAAAGERQRLWNGGP